MCRRVCFGSSSLLVSELDETLLGESVKPSRAGIGAVAQGPAAVRLPWQHRRPVVCTRVHWHCSTAQDLRVGHAPLTFADLRAGLTLP